MLPIGPVLDDIQAALRTTDVRIPLAENLASFGGRSPAGEVFGSSVIIPPSDRSLLNAHTTSKPQPDMAQTVEVPPQAPVSSTSSSARLAPRSVPERLREGMRRLMHVRQSRHQKCSKRHSDFLKVITIVKETTLPPQRERSPPLFLMHPGTGDNTGPSPVAMPQLPATRDASSTDVVEPLHARPIPVIVVHRPRALEGFQTPERGRTLSRSRHLRHPYQKTHSRNRSESSTIRTSDSYSDEILPERINCLLELHLDAAELETPAPVVSVAWLNKDSFDRIMSTANQCLMKRNTHLQEAANSEDTDLPLPDHNLETGSYRIVGKHHATPSRKLDNEHQLVEVLIPSICGFISGHPREKFEVEIRWNYSSILIRKEPDRPYKATIIDAIHAKLRRNFCGKEFIPRSDLNRITSAMESRLLVDEDVTVKDNVALKRAIYPEVREDKAERLLAVCIYALIDLSFLESLLLCSKFSDQNYPKRTNWPLPVNKAEFDRFMFYVPMFFAHKFGEEEKANPKEYANIPDDVIVPISFLEDANGQDFLGSGAFSEVYRATIHPYHHVFSQVRCMTSEAANTIC
jgi:hypothetical protein